MRRLIQFSIAALLLSVAGPLLVLTPASAQTYTLSTLATFDVSNGSSPFAVLILSGGTLYGTTYHGGPDTYGTVFSVPITGNGSTGAVTILASFDGTNGSYPSDLILSGGTLYGMTSGGGADGDGTVFSVPVTGDGSTGAVTTLATFDVSNGQEPLAGLVLSGGTLYGTTYVGGADGDGTIFSVPVTGNGSTSAVTTLATFNGSNGELPYTGLVLSGGTLYGTTSQGGANGDGTVFSVPVGGGAVTILATFNGSNGALPYTGMLLSGGTLYGTTSQGGANGDGTVFSVPVGGGAVTTLATFNVSNGEHPKAGLVLSGGTLYGTTSQGGANGDGTVFSVPVNGNGSTAAVTTLASFNGTNGLYPGSLVLSGGSLYGTTQDGGAGGDGTVFALTPTPAGSSYVLWNNSGTASLWRIPVSGASASASFGPFTGWTPTAVASDSSGNAYMLWNSTTGAASVWKISASLTVSTSQSFGPYTGWTAKSLAVGPDGHVHLFWNHMADNEASIFNIVLGSSFTTNAYGPYSNWQSTQIAVDSANNTRLLWDNTSTGVASLWNITSGGTETSEDFGPYSGWQAQNLAVGTDNLARILWENASTKQGSIFTVASDDSFTSQAFGPYSGWVPAGLAVNNDGDSDLMWTSTANEISIFDIGSSGSFTSSGDGPFRGWKAVGIATGP